MTNLNRVCRPIRRSEATLDPAPATPTGCQLLLSANAIVVLGAVVLIDREQRRHPTVPTADENSRTSLTDQTDPMCMRGALRRRQGALAAFGQGLEVSPRPFCENRQPLTKTSFGRPCDVMASAPCSSAAPPPVVC